MTPSKIYCIGAIAGSIDLQVFYSHQGSSASFSVHYLNGRVRQLGAVRKLSLPQGDETRWLIDAAIAFHPQLFRGCPSLRSVEKQLRNTSDLDILGGNLPPNWVRLREEATQAFSHLRVYEAAIRPLPTQTLLPGNQFSIVEAMRAATQWLHRKSA